MSDATDATGTADTTGTAGTADTTESAPARRPIAGPFAWRGAELAERDWIRPLPEGALDEIDAALGGVKPRPGRCRHVSIQLCRR